jgi:hypothetical protein
LVRFKSVLAEFTVKYLKFRDWREFGESLSREELKILEEIVTVLDRAEMSVIVSKTIE